jgi:hypothetical protein
MPSLQMFIYMNNDPNARLHNKQLPSSIWWHIISSWGSKWQTQKSFIQFIVKIWWTVYLIFKLHYPQESCYYPRLLGQSISGRHLCRCWFTWIITELANL